MVIVVTNKRQKWSWWINQINVNRGKPSILIIVPWYFRSVRACVSGRNLHSAVSLLSRYYYWSVVELIGSDRSVLHFRTFLVLPRCDSSSLIANICIKSCYIKSVPDMPIKISSVDGISIFLKVVLSDILIL